jgi:hypothetical protein
MSTLVPAYNATRLLRRSREINNSEESSYVRAFVAILKLLAKAIELLLLLGLLVLTGLVWLWLASFRMGSRFGSWVYSFFQAKSDERDKLTLGLLYSSIVALVSPLAVLGDWSQELISQRFRVTCPPQINLKEVIKTQLGIDLPEKSLCFPESDSESHEEQALADSSSK